MIQVSNLDFTYPGNKEPTIKGVSFSLAQGEIFGFLGPSGAGKSTVQKVLIGLLQGYRGSVRVMGTEVRDIGRQFYAKIGVAFENPNFYPKLTPLENLEFFGSLYPDGIRDPLELLESVGLGESINKKAGDFSKGMKVRLNFCRSLLNDPLLLFLDEPTAGLDPENARRIKNIILSCKEEGKTVFLTTHDMKVAEDICDRVAFIVDGQINLIDSPRELKVARGKKLVRLEYRNEAGINAQEFPLQGIMDNPDFARLMREEDVETIHTLEPNLEDIFIEVTGRRLT